MYSRTISFLAATMAFASFWCLRTVSATVLMSAHFFSLERPGAESHFFARASRRPASGRRVRRSVALLSSSQGSWPSRMSASKLLIRTR